jgi:hypothetical protein
MIKKVLLVSLAAGVSIGAWAKLPPPSDDAKAKSAEAAAKSAHTGKVDGYKLCLSMNKVAAHYQGQAKAAGKAVTPVATPECADPGPYVSPAEAAAKAAATPAATPAAAAPAAAAPAKKS